MAPADGLARAAGIGPARMTVSLFWRPQQAGDDFQWSSTGTVTAVAGAAGDHDDRSSAGAAAATAAQPYDANAVLSAVAARLSIADTIERSETEAFIPHPPPRDGAASQASTSSSRPPTRCASVAVSELARQALTASSGQQPPHEDDEGDEDKTTKRGARHVASPGAGDFRPPASAADLARALRPLILGYDGDGSSYAVAAAALLKKRRHNNRKHEGRPSVSNAEDLLGASMSLEGAGRPMAQPAAIGAVVDCSVDLVAERAAPVAKNESAAADGACADHPGEPSAPAANVQATHAAPNVMFAVALRSDDRSLGCGLVLNQQPSGASPSPAARRGTGASCSSSSSQGPQYVLEICQPLVDGGAWRPALRTRHRGTRFVLQDVVLEQCCFRVTTIVGAFTCHASAAVMYHQPAPPAGPSIGVSVVGVSHDAVRLKWTPPSNAMLHNGLQYEIRAHAVNDDTTTPATNGGVAAATADASDWTVLLRTAATEGVAPGLFIDTPYEVVVVPFSTFGVGEPSPPARFRTSRRVKPGALRQPRPPPLPPLALVMSRGAPPVAVFRDLAPPFDEIRDWLAEDQAMNDDSRGGARRLPTSALPVVTAVRPGADQSSRAGRYGAPAPPPGRHLPANRRGGKYSLPASWDMPPDGFPR